MQNSYNKYFPNKNNGFLVEIGVGHTLDGIDNIVDGTLDKIKNISRCGSNTADLLDLGWSGIYIEPVLEYCDEAKISHLYSNLEQVDPEFFDEIRATILAKIK